MKKVRIRLVKIGYLPKSFDQQLVLDHSSKIFSIEDGVHTLHLSDRAGLRDGSWGYSDEQLENVVPQRTHEDLLLAFTNVSLQDNYYARRLENNRAIFTFHEVKEILDFHNLPLENFVFRMLYEYSLLYMRFEGRVPDIGVLTNFTHDETRGCLFDMNGRKVDLYTSCDRPIICYECETKLKKEKISNEIIDAVRLELRQIKKRFYYWISDIIKERPITALMLSSAFAIILGIIGSFAYDGLKVFFHHLDWIQ